MRPWRKALRDERCLPAGVRGPVDRLEVPFEAEVISDAPEPKIACEWRSQRVVVREVVESGREKVAIVVVTNPDVLQMCDNVGVGLFCQDSRHGDPTVRMGA